MAITSQKTAQKQVPAIHKLVAKYEGWKRGTTNFDIGGGPWDANMFPDVEIKGQLMVSHPKEFFKEK